MKNVLFPLFLLFANFANSQNLSPMNPEKKYVEVTGVAEMEVVPNEIYLSITLQEEKEGLKRSVEKQEQLLIEKLKKLNIELSNLKLSNVGSNTYWDKKTMTSYKQKTFELKIADAGKASEVMYELSALQIYNMYVARTSHSDIEKFKKEVKIEAVKAAKEKASYLLEAVNEEVGDILFIVEQENYYGAMYRNEMAFSNVAMDTGGYTPEASVEFQPINLKYSILARFEIK